MTGEKRQLLMVLGQTADALHSDYGVQVVMVVVDSNETHDSLVLTAADPDSPLVDRASKLLTQDDRACPQCAVKDRRIQELKELVDEVDKIAGQRGEACESKAEELVTLRAECERFKKIIERLKTEVPKTDAGWLGRWAHILEGGK